MKFYYLVITTLFSSAIFAQTPPVSGYKLWLDASDASSFVPGTVSTPTTWSDLSGNKNHVRTDLPTSINPTLVTYKGFPAVHFIGDNVMFNDSADATFSNTEATVFIVTNAKNTQSSISIAENLNVKNEFVIENNNVYHHSSSSNWIGKGTECIPTADSIIILSGAWKTGATSSDVNSYINNIKSTKPTSIGGASVSGSYGSPSNYTIVNRRVHIGGRYQAGFVYSGHQYNGYMYEVIAYNRCLSDFEIAQVNNYLKQKYSLNYALCNATGIEDAENASITIFPNPVQGQLTVKATTSNIAYVKIFDNIGRTILENTYENAVAELKLNTANWQAGMYNVVLTTATNETLKYHFVKTEQ